MTDGETDAGLSSVQSIKIKVVLDPRASSMRQMFCMACGFGQLIRIDDKEEKIQKMVRMMRDHVLSHKFISTYCSRYGQNEWTHWLRTDEVKGETLAFSVLPPQKAENLVAEEPHLV